MVAQRVSEAATSLGEAHCDAKAGIVDMLIARAPKKMANLIICNSKLSLML
jgi:hypothetical protein